MTKGDLSYQPIPPRPEPNTVYVVVSVIDLSSAAEIFGDFVFPMSSEEIDIIRQMMNWVWTRQEAVRARMKQVEDDTAFERSLLPGQFGNSSTYWERE